jgi:hypothetical protein
VGEVLFEFDEELHLFEPGSLTIPQQVEEEIPDVGGFFIAWATQDLRADQARELEAAVNGRRCSNGWFPLDSLDNIGRRGFWRGPLTYLAQITARDPMLLQNWASTGLQGDDKRRIDATANHLLFQQGHAAAATWVMAVRPQALLNPRPLGESLYRSWEECISSLRTKDIAKAVRRWNR